MSITTIYGLRIELVPRTSVDSVLFPKNLTIEEIHQRIVDLSRARAFHLASASVAKSSQNTLNREPETLKPPISSSPLAILYLTKMSIGSSKFSPYLVVDTGVDDTWLQCEGCKSCFPVKGGSFSAQQSKSYHASSCDDPLCFDKSCFRNVCSYNWMYRDGGLLKGVLGTDSFTFNGGNSTGITFPTLAFGCAYESQNIIFGGYIGSENVISGVFGLGAGQRSILKQLETVTDLRFSYCLPSWTFPNGSSTFLRFGPDAQITGDDKRKVQTISLIPNMSRYYVNVTGISVDEKRLDIDPGLFKLKNDGSGGFAIDSGVGPTLLVPDAYSVLRAQMIRNFFRYAWHPIEGKETPYDLCFKAASSAGNIDVKIPSMTIHFQGGDLAVGSNSVFESIDGLLCLIFQPTEQLGPNLLGAFQQANNRFLFDVKKSTVSFVPETCNEK
ncbi:hypothetical protein Pint_20609 [Pistacia integerrima]|uniref:Uncharacterized protein n=1 Tax=Pistacia integerrima TaxID=434235 RepID=A0ACC0XFC2_9ROSI|nr:hypothetical protein Pint_20609 [Pistacia integerrima]